MQALLPLPALGRQLHAPGFEALAEALQAQLPVQLPLTAALAILLSTAAAGSWSAAPLPVRSAGPQELPCSFHASFSTQGLYARHDTIIMALSASKQGWTQRCKRRSTCSCLTQLYQPFFFGAGWLQACALLVPCQSVQHSAPAS